MPEERKIWVSELNQPARAAFRGAKRVRFYDTTLRDGEQTVGVVLSPQQKLEIARKLDELGVARIEAGFPRVSAEDAEAFRLILGAGLKAEIWGFARAQKADVEALKELGIKASVIEIPTSDLKLKAYGISRDEAVKRATDAIAAARAAGIRVAFFGVDGTRSDIAFLERVYRAAMDAGAEELVVVDTIGVCGPEAVEFLITRVKEWAGDRAVHFHGHNDFGLGTACAIAAVRAGAEWIQGTINGMGERAGNADLGEIALALTCLYNVPVEMRLEEVRGVSEAVQRAAGYTLEGWKPAVGDYLFMRESGAVASQFHMPEAIEPYAAELVGARRGIVLGKKSGLDSIALKAKELGIDVPEDQRAAVLAAVKKRGVEKRGLVNDDELRAIVAQLAHQSAGATK